jgi:hypothetical protein
VPNEGKEEGTGWSLLSSTSRKTSEREPRSRELGGVNNEDDDYNYDVSFSFDLMRVLFVHSRN